LQYTRSPLNYIGGKYKLLDSIIPVFPNKIGKFVDLFCGGLNVGINVNADTIYANDQISYIIDLYKYFQSIDTDELIKRIEARIAEYRLSNDNKDSYVRLREEYNRTRKILDLFVLTCFSYNHQIRFNSKHEFNTSFGMRRYNEKIKINLIQFCTALHSKNFMFSSIDFRSFDFSILSSGDFVYCDPPYSISTASYNDGKRGFNGWSNKDDIDLFHLLDSLNDKGILFALSNVIEHKGMHNDSLINWSKSYNTIDIETDYSAASYNLKDRYCETHEVLITNFKPKKSRTEVVSANKLF
jgi:DNA adenine methylase